MKYVVVLGAMTLASNAEASEANPGRVAQAAAPRALARTQFLANVAAKFRTLDANHDGVLTLDELKAAQAAQNTSIESQIATRRAQVFARLDANHDGVISKAEFEGVTPSVKGPDTSANFSRLDTNHDGKVSMDEYQTLQLARYNTLDGNHDGVVTPQELQAARRAPTRR